VPADHLRESFLTVAARCPGGQHGVGAKDTLQGLGGSSHGGIGSGSRWLTRTAPTGKGREEPD
jgi:hypothetical protein